MLLETVSRKIALAVLLSWLAPAVVVAQVVPLPPLENRQWQSLDAAVPAPAPSGADFSPPWGAAESVAYQPGSAARVLEDPGRRELSPQLVPPSPQWSGATEESLEMPLDVRPGMFQQLVFEGTWLARTSGSRGMGQYDLELKSVLAVPCPTRDSPLLIVPGFAVRYTDGPENLPIPPRLYDAYCQFRWLHRLSPRLGVDLSLVPGVYSDFEQSYSESFRWTGYGAAAWTMYPKLQLVAGVGYFNRLDVKLLPIGGLIWKPTADDCWELLFPKPSISRRVAYRRGPEGTIDREDWLYLCGEFGGGTWAIATAVPEPDLLDIKDYRLIVGWQRKQLGGIDSRCEIGYVFGRRIEFRNIDPGFSCSDTVLLRVGLTY
jgi:hypothetical protein